VVDLALAELVEERAIAVVEWGDMAAPALGDDTLSVTLALPDAGTTSSTEERIITISGQGNWADRADEVEAVLSGSQRSVAR
jgi:tRNA A37 threonylcarbamoyladenosine biosynthesis protein TsaE